MACGPSKEELDAWEKAKADSVAAVTQATQKAETEKQQAIANQEKPKKYFLANQFDLIPGTIVGWAPTDETIFTWKCNGGTVPDRAIYIHIQDQYGMVTVMKCNHMAWINLHTGDVLR
jgi:plastocyanin